MAALAQKRKVSAPRRKSRRNPAGAAAEMFEKFTGQESTGVEEYVESEHYHGNLAQLGVLVELKVRTVNGDKVVIGFDVGDGEDQVENPFWSSARSAAKTIGGSALGKLKRIAASRKEAARWIKYDSYESEVRAQAKRGYLEAHGVEAKIEKTRTRLLPYPKYKFEVFVDREKLRAMFQRDEEEKLTLRKEARERALEKRSKVRGSSSGGGSKSVGLFKGYQIKKTDEGFTIPKLDPDSVFDSKNDAKTFILTQHKNPGPIASTFGKAQAQGGKLFKYVDGQLGKIGGKLLKKNPAGSNPTLLCCSEDGRSMYLVGGDQRLNLEDLGLGGDFEKDSMVIGDLLNIVYQARKKFDKFQEIHYTHKVGEESGDLPILRYDRLNERLYIDGGKYTVEDVGIVN